MVHSTFRAFRFRVMALQAIACLCLVSAAYAEPIALPWFGQKTTSDCGRAVLASLAARKGTIPDVAYQTLPAPADRLQGYSVQEMRRLAPRVGVKLTLRSPQGLVIAGECSPRPAVTEQIDKLAEAVGLGIPVVVPVETRGSFGHYLVLIEAEGDSFTVHDPARPAPYAISRKQLLLRMCKFGYLALLVD